MNDSRWHDPREGDSVVDLATLVRGFHLAKQRFADVDTHMSTGLETFVPLFEALNWAVSIDVFLAARQEPIVRALRFGRNRVHHDWANALYFMPGAEAGVLVVGVSRLGVASRWHWRFASELPAGRTDADGEAAYRELLEGQPAGLTLALFDQFLARRLGES